MLSSLICKIKRKLESERERKGEKTKKIKENVRKKRRSRRDKQYLKLLVDTPQGNETGTDLNILWKFYSFPFKHWGSRTMEFITAIARE